MRLLACLSLLTCLAASLLHLPAAAADNVEDFSGVWVAWLCPPGAQRESGKCSNFVLELHQKEGKLCGAHFYSTAGAERIDEGAAPSVVGDIVDGTATAVVISGRGAQPARVKVEMKRTGATLQWLRMESPHGDYLRPPSARLTKSRSKTLFAPVFEQELKATCLSLFTIEAQKAQKMPEGAKE